MAKNKQGVQKFATKRVKAGEDVLTRTVTKARKVHKAKVRARRKKG